MFFKPQVCVVYLFPYQSLSLPYPFPHHFLFSAVTLPLFLNFFLPHFLSLPPPLFFFLLLFSLFLLFSRFLHLFPLYSPFFPFSFPFPFQSGHQSSYWLWTSVLNFSELTRIGVIHSPPHPTPPHKFLNLKSLLFRSFWFRIRKHNLASPGYMPVSGYNLVLGYKRFEQNQDWILNQKICETEIKNSRNSGHLL